MTELNGPDVVACCHLVAGVSTGISADSHRSSLVNCPTEETIIGNMISEEMETTHLQEHAENSKNVVIIYNYN